MNDFPQHIKLAQSNIFADDGAIYCSGKSYTKVKENLQISVNDADEWYNTNKFSINLTKSLSMMCASDRNLNQLSADELNLDIHMRSVKVSSCPYS